VIVSDFVLITMIKQRILMFVQMHF